MVDKVVGFVLQKKWTKAKLKKYMALLQHFLLNETTALYTNDILQIIFISKIHWRQRGCDRYVDNEPMNPRLLDIMTAPEKIINFYIYFLLFPFLLRLSCPFGIPTSKMLKKRR